jgi:hypothetical protein
VSPAEGRSGAPAEIDFRGPVPDLSVFGLDPQADIPCLPVRYQIAQKLHACTEPTTHRENDRFRDLIDLVLLAELVEDDAWPAVRAACLEVFALRARHPWPPRVAVLPGWPDPYAIMAGQTRFPIEDVYEAAAEVAALVERIDVAAVAGRG